MLRREENFLEVLDTSPKFAYLVGVVLNRHALTDLREARGLTKRELADAAGVSASYLTELEKGDKPGTPKVIKRLAEALAVNSLSLITCDEKAS